VHELTAEQKKELEELHIERGDLSMLVERARQRAEESARKALGLEKGSSETDDPDTWEKVAELTNKDALYQKRNEELARVWEKIEKLETPHSMHGWVWVYLQKPRALKFPVPGR
jgi:hypothetical protein